MKRIMVFLSVSVYSINLYALDRDTQVATPWIQEMSQGFASVFTSDKLAQNFISGLLSPFIIIVFIALVAYVIYRIIKYMDFLEKQKQHYVQQLILFKAKEKGLSNYQIKVLRGITEILRRDEAIRIMGEPLLFEKYIKDFIQYIKQIKTGNETLETICRDIITIYEKIYHGNDIRRPLPSPSEIEKNTVMAINSEKGDWFICKLRTASVDSLILYIINTPSEKIIHFVPGENVNAIFFRGGDAEYRFSTEIINHEGSLLKLKLPEKLERGEPVPHPLVNVNLTCEISKPGAPGEEREILQADIFRLNETEAVVRLESILKHGTGNEISFQISDFTVHSEVQVISEKQISKHGTYYYNLKFVNISDAAKKVIYNFLESTLFDV